MAKQTINIGSVPNDGTGSTLREGGDLINDNFNEIYTAIGDGTTLTSGTFLTTTNSETVQNKTIDGTQNTLQNIPNSALDSIANSALTNSTISIGGITFNLGDTDATPAIDLSDATNYPTSSLTGTITNAQLAGSIENAKLSNSTVSIVADDSSAQSISLGGSILFTGGSGITTAISGNEITFSTDGSIVTETSSDVLTNKTINGPDNTLTNIANGSLANSTITLGSDTLNLGDTSTTITGLSLDGTGTIDLTGSGSKARFNFAGFGSLPTAATYEGMFAYDTTGQVPYVADAGGWTRIQTENDSISVHSDVNLTGIADGYILQWSSAQARFNVVANAGGVSDIVDDTTPQLGGNLDTNGNDINFGDNDKAVFGAGTDLQIYHDGTDSIIGDVAAGNLLLTTNGTAVKIVKGVASSETIASFNEDSSVDLYYDNSKKFETTTNGITVTGNVLPAANDTYDLGASGNVWANIYTGDLNLSNEAKEQGNSVDGTKGNWTIQEGAEDLFLINNNSGKKYKFTLEEI